MRSETKSCRSFSEGGKKLSVIIATLFVFALAGCVKNVNVKAPKASANAVAAADSVTDFIVANGVKDPDCKTFEKCYKVAYNYDSGDGSVLANFEFKVVKKFGKMTLVINEHMAMTSLGEDGLEHKYESAFNSIDTKANGAVDYLNGVITNDNEVLLTILYEDGVVTTGGFVAQFLTEPLTPQDVQPLYENMLKRVVQLIGIGVLK